MVSSKYNSQGGPGMMSSKDRMYLRSFMEIIKVLASTLAVDEVLDQIVRQISEVMSLKGATIRLVNPKTNTLEVAASQGVSDKYLQKGPVDLDKFERFFPASDTLHTKFV